VKRAFTRFAAEYHRPLKVARRGDRVGIMLVGVKKEQVAQERPGQVKAAKLDFDLANLQRRFQTVVDLLQHRISRAVISL
jgi:hypothetical protein